MVERRRRWPIAAGLRLRVLGRLAAFSIACTYLASCERASVPSIDGDGELHFLDIPEDRGASESIVTVDERFVVLRTRAPRPFLCPADERLRPIRRTTRAPKKLAPSRGSDATVLALFRDRFEVLALPDLRAKETLPLAPRLSVDVLGFGSHLLCPNGAGWVCVQLVGSHGSGAKIAQIEPSPLRLGRSGKAQIKNVRAVAADDKTGKLVLCGDRNLAEVYDLTRRESVAKIPLDCSAVDYDGVCAGDGIAWIATEDGLILCLDIASASVTGRTRVTKSQGPSRVAVDLALSGRYLAASAQPRRRDDVPTVLRIFSVNGARLSEVASARANLPGVLNDITTLEREKLVILSGRPVLVWRYGAKKEDTNGR